MGKVFGLFLFIRFAIYPFRYPFCYLSVPLSVLLFIRSAIECIEITNLRTFSSIYKTRVEITWDAVPSATLYQVSVLRFPLSLSSKQNVSTNKTTLSHLSPGSSYTITCKVLEFNNTPSSLSVSSPKLLKLVMNSDTYPSVTNVNSSSKTTSLNISWDNIANATLYKLVYTGGRIKEERELKTDQNFVDIVGLTKNTTYNVTVLVTEINNRIPENAAQSNWYAFTTTSEESIEITNLRTFSSIYKTRVEITWDAVPNATLYQVTAVENLSLLSFKQNVSTNKTTLNHLSPGSSYTITCKVLEFNNMATSLSVSSKNLLRLVMNSDTYPNITNVNSSSKAKSLNVSWDNFTNATLYKLVYTGGSITEEKESETNQNFVDIVGLTENTTYNIMVLVVEMNNRMPKVAAQSSLYGFNTAFNGCETRMVCQILSRHIAGLMIFYSLIFMSIY